MASATGVVIAKPIKGRVPEWFEALNQQRFTKGNPNIFNKQVAAGEIAHVKIGSLFYRCCMFTQTV